MQQSGKCNKKSKKIICSVMKKLCVIFGGKSCEHDVSIITGMQLAKNYGNEIEKIYLGLDNKFYLATKINSLKQFQDKTNLKLKEVIFHDSALYSKGLISKKIFDVECVINCCHGGVGENGDLKSFFSLHKVKCTSTNSLSAHVTMNKSLCKRLVSEVVPTVKGVCVSQQDFEECCKLIEDEFSSELIVKPNSLGSSIGVAACDKENYQNQIQAIFNMNDDALVEERVVDMVEYNQACMIIDGEIVLSAIEQPVSKSDFLSFDDKYNSAQKGKQADRIIPADISQKLEKEINETTRQIYSLLHLEGIVRIDYIYDNKKKKLYFNEVNTIPGSMAYYLFEPIGIDYITLINNLIQNTKDVEDYSFFETDILKTKEI